MNINQEEFSALSKTSDSGTFEVVDEETTFHAPASSDLIDRLVGEYQMYRGHIEEIASIATGGLANALHYFIEGNQDENTRYSVGTLFDKAGAVEALNSAYWSKALALTDVLDCMPQARRDSWNAQINRKRYVERGSRREAVAELPDFEESTVRDTLADLLGQRAMFMAERVDGIFRSLSGEHVTNSPAGFSKRMIINYMLSYGSISNSRAGIINDLRCVIAKLMGRDEPKYSASEVLVSKLYAETGKWVCVDGNALKIRVYKKGTAHLEVHPDLAWRLNQILASMYPAAIPSEFRQKPKTRSKEFAMMTKTIPFKVIELLTEDQRYHRVHAGEHSYTFSTYQVEKAGKAVVEQAKDVLKTIGGVQRSGSWNTFDFDYSPREIIREICVSGSIPDHKSHQFYPTPQTIATAAIELAEIQDTDICLEPSAGLGNLSSLMPIDRTTCVEISPLHCKVLVEKGYNAICEDFIIWADINTNNGVRFDKIVLNPPFSEGRAKLHLEAAAGMLKPGGKLVAILPSGFKSKTVLPGWKVETSRLYNDEFAGTSVSVVILSATRPL